MKFCRKFLKKIKLFVLYWTRIVFVKNNFKVSPFNKLRSNFFGGYLADQAILYDFKNNDKSEYLSEFDWYKSRYINEPFDFAFNNKVVCAEILKQFIHVPENYFIKNKGQILDFKNGIRTKGDVYERLIEKGRLIIKPFALGKGNGVHMLSYDNENIEIDGKEKNREELFKFLDDRDAYIICQYMTQHVYASDIYDKTVNTIRLITMRDIETHEFKIFFAVQRIGTKKTIPVDNGSKGGLVAKIDLESGTLSEARCLHDLNSYDVHPDSHKPIKGVMIPQWDDMKRDILEAANHLPYMDFIAWDLVVTEDGISVIEANTSSGVNIIQLWGGQRKKQLGDFFRYYDVIK